MSSVKASGGVKKPTLEQYIRMLIILSKGKTDRIGRVAEIMLVAGGGVLAWLAAPALWAVVGWNVVTVTGTFLGSTFLGGLLGVTTTVDVPPSMTFIVFVVASVIIFMVILSRIMHGSGMQDQIRKNLEQDLLKKIYTDLEKMKQMNQKEKIGAVAGAILTATVQKKLSMEEGLELLTNIDSGRYTPEFVMNSLKTL